ncbi:prosaposin-like [Rhynchophorus ferrugineus]|uniref:prosaposin-like n=1 Tax=Rhynchophorus ferrugineus TaxID=354439 RepID=UPI003FCC6067
MQFLTFIYVILSIFVVVFGSPQLLGANKCTRGPGYWCLSRENALSCNTLQYCETRVWSRQG